jgi:hypothetical protein
MTKAGSGIPEADPKAGIYTQRLRYLLSPFWHFGHKRRDDIMDVVLEILFARAFVV